MHCIKPKYLIYILITLGLPIGIFGQETYRDNFGSVSYSNNDGSQNFSSSWSESGDNNSPWSGRILISSNQLRFLDMDNASISRTLNVAGASAVTLTMDYDRTNGNESISVELYDGSSYNSVATLNGSGTVNYNLDPSEIGSSLAIRFVSNSGNWGSSESIYVDNLQFLVTLADPDDPPVVVATGDQTYCAGGSTPIAETISITDPDDTMTSVVYIQISTGYINGEDLLTLTGSHPNISSTWDAVQGELTLTGPATHAEFEAAILAVNFSSSSPNPSVTKQFSITVGEANYLPATGHYYEYIDDLGITWTAANTAANNRTYFGLQGYLATLTSQVEADFSGAQASGVGWIGGSDAATEGVWRWVTGPESGTIFWNGTAGGSSPNFAFWNTGEPNQAGDEDYAHITHPNVNPNGSWNDLSNTGAGSGDYQPQGYVVEYGGMPGDPVLSISDITTLNMDTEAPTASNPAPLTVCEGAVPGSDITVVTDESDNCSPAPTVTFLGDVSDGGSNPEIITRTYRVTDDAGNYADVTQTITVVNISVNSQPADQVVVTGTQAQFSVTTTNADTFQWQVSTNGGGSFSNIVNGPEYAGTDTATLTVLWPQISMNSYRYRVLVSRSGSGCDEIISSQAVLNVNVRSVITNRKITYRVNRG